ncbi:MAG: spore cortex biosynthesis protein YabQ [Clostridiales bacterium]|jgi:spore cortex biosynthesis protein YabQ|nr:spore cortex biosynthesis protein YabQ [Clostridiales bacterium]
MLSQTTLFFISVLAGFAIGFVYDLFRVTRLAVKHHNAVVQVEDAMFWLIAAAGMFLLTLHVNGGETRAFSFVGAAVGAVLYFATLSRVIIKIFIAVITVIKKIIKAVTRLILIPVRFIVKTLSVLASFAFEKVKLAEKPAKNLLQKSKRYVKIKKKSFKRSLNILKKI